MSSDPNAIVATRVRELRMKKGWSQEELAAHCELHRTYIGAIERAERNVTLRTLDRIAKALGCEIADLIQLKNEKR